MPHRDNDVMLIAVLFQLCADNEGPDDSIPPLHRAGLPPVMSPPAQIPFPCSPRVSRPADPLALPTEGHAEAAAAAQRLRRGHTGTAPCERRRSGAAAAVPARQTPCPGLEGAGASCSHPGRVWDPAQPHSWAVQCPLSQRGDTEVVLRWHCVPRLGCPASTPSSSSWQLPCCEASALQRGRREPQQHLQPVPVSLGVCAASPGWGGPSPAGSLGWWEQVARGCPWMPHLWLFEEALPKPESTQLNAGHFRRKRRDRDFSCS